MVWARLQYSKSSLMYLPLFVPRFSLNTIWRFLRDMPSNKEFPFRVKFYIIFNVHTGLQTKLRDLWWSHNSFSEEFVLLVYKIVVSDFSKYRTALIFKSTWSLKMQAPLFPICQQEAKASYSRRPDLLAWSLKHEVFAAPSCMQLVMLSAVQSAAPTWLSELRILSYSLLSQSTSHRFL